MHGARLIRVVAAACVVVGISLCAPEAQASPQGKTYLGSIVFPQPTGATCAVFNSDGSFTLTVPGQIETSGSWFAIGPAWFSFSTSGSGGTNTLVIILVGTTFGADNEVLVASGLLGLADYPLPPQPFVTAGGAISGPCEAKPAVSEPKGKRSRK